MQVDMVENIGFAAAACTTLSFIPQLTKIRKQGGRDLYLTYTMLSVYLLGLALWLAYGIWLHAPAVVVAHAASIALVVAAIVMKAIVVVPPQAPSEIWQALAESQILNPRIDVQSLVSPIRPKRQTATKTVKNVVLWRQSSRRGSLHVLIDARLSLKTWGLAKIFPWHRCAIRLALKLRGISRCFRTCEARRT